MTSRIHVWREFETSYAKTDAGYKPNGSHIHADNTSFFVSFLPTKPIYSIGVN